MCQFATLEPDREIDLDTALYALEAALPADDPKGNGFDHANDDNGDTERTDWVALTQKILAGKDLHDSTVRLAASYVGSGMTPEHALRLLQSLMLASSAPHDERWQARFAYLPRLVKDGQAKYGTTEEEPPKLPFIKMSNWDNEPVPEQEWAVPDRIPPRTNRAVLRRGRLRQKHDPRTSLRSSRARPRLARSLPEPRTGNFP